MNKREDAVVGAALARALEVVTMSLKKLVKIVAVERHSEARAEAELSRLVNEGWAIVAGGGFGATSVGFVVLQKDVNMA